MSARVLCVFPPSYLTAGNFYIPNYEVPLGICYLASWCGKHGLDVDLLDMSLPGENKDLGSLVREKRYEIVAFASFSAYIEEAARQAEKVKAASPDTHTVIGAYHASSLPVETLEEFPSFDSAVAGEGELTFLELAQAVLGGGTAAAEIQGAAWREKDGSVHLAPTRREQPDLDMFPFPARDKLPVHRYMANSINFLETSRTTGIITSRGCAFTCTFCAKNMWKKERRRSVNNVVDEVEHCLKDLGITGFRFYDETFTTSREFVAGFCEEMIRRDLRVAWNCFSRVDCIDAELVKLMKAAGCFQIKYGLESGTDKGLEITNKKITREQAIEAIAVTKKAGVETQVSVILGLPGEDEADMRATVAFARRLNPDLIGFNIFKPIPGSVLFKQLRKQGLLDMDKWEDLSIKVPKYIVKGEHTTESMARMLKYAYRSYYLRPGYVLGRLRWLARNPRRETVRLADGLKLLFKEFFSKKGEPSLGMVGH